jgi:hypothetical protein
MPTEMFLEDPNCGLGKRGASTCKAEQGCDIFGANMYCVKIGELKVVGHQRDERKRDARVTFNDVSTRLDIAELRS